MGNRQSRAIGAAFFSLGFLFGSWATFIPFVKEQFALNDANLGLILLSLPMGAVTMNLMGAFLVSRLGMKTTVIGGMIGMALAFSIPLNVSHLWMVPLGLYFCGAGISICNIAMNIGVTSIEAHQKINIMSTCHGMFSVGLMVGSLMASLVRGLELNPGFYMALVALFIFSLALFIRKTIFRIHEEPNEQEVQSTRFFLPQGAFLIMIVIGICGNIVEGTMVDWTSVYMRDVVNTNPYFIGWGLSGYSLFMALGRLFGDTLIPRFGANKILSFGGFLAMLGLAVAVVFPFTYSAIVGFSLVGMGVSCTAPILYASAARVPGKSKGTGLAIMNTFAMLGFMAGPVLIGLVAEATSLQISLTLVLCLAAIWGLLSAKVKLF